MSKLSSLPQNQIKQLRWLSKDRQIFKDKKLEWTKKVVDYTEKPAMLQLVAQKLKNLEATMGLLEKEKCKNCDGFGTEEIKFGHGQCRTCTECLGTGYGVGIDEHKNLPELPCR